MKKGFVTTEFWLTAFSGLLAWVLNSGLLPDQHWSVKLAAVLAGGLAAFGYSGSRAKVKAAAK